MFRLSSLLSLAALSSALLAAPSPSTTSSADWPGFRGLKRNDLSPDKGLLNAWSAKGPRLLWKATGVGEGFSSMAVVGNKVFTMGDKDKACHVFALSRDKGEILWSTKVGEAGGNYRGPRCTPTVDGDLLYAIGQFGDLVCLETAEGKEKWRTNFGKDFNGSSGGWNYTESPLIDGDRLVCTPGGAKATMVVLDKKTGDEIWRAPLNQSAGYSSIVISNAAKVKQYVQLTAEGTIGVAAKDGKLLWHYPKFSGNTANVPTPIVVGNQIFTTTGYGRGAALLTLSADGDGVKFKEVYHTRTPTNKHGGVLIFGDYLYGDSGDGGDIVCVEWKTGKVIWSRNRTKGPRGKGGGSASLTCADGKLFIHYQSGWVAMVPASPKGYVEKGGFQVSEARGEWWAHPVVIGGAMYIREGDVLRCYDVKGK